MAEKKEMNVYFGGWYQRTTLHLTEIANFFVDGRSDLPLSKAKLMEFHEGFVERVKNI